MFCIPQLSSNPTPCKEMKRWGAVFQLIEKVPSHSPEGWVVLGDRQ